MYPATGLVQYYSKSKETDIKPVSYTSQSLSPVEKDMLRLTLAFAWASQTFSLEFQTDHKPLVPLFSTKHLEELPVSV